MEIIYRKLSELKPNPKNPRKGTKEAIEKLAESIKGNPKFFEARPILLSDRTGQLVIIGGERRSEAAALLKMETVPTILMSGLTEAQEEEILIKDNTHAGVWDEQKLQSWGKDQLQSWNVDGVKWPVRKTEIKKENFNPNKKVESRVNPGELWQLGKHRLLCGDSTKAESFTKLMMNKEARLCITSPPYGVGKSYEEYGIEPWKKTVFAVYENICNNSRIAVINIGDLYSTGTQFIEPTSTFTIDKFESLGFGLLYSRIWQKQGGNFAGTNPYYTVTMKPVQEYEWILGFAKREYEKDYAPIISWFNQQALNAGLNNEKLKQITGAGFMYGHWFTSHQFAFIDERNYKKIQQYCQKNNIDAFNREYKDIRREYDNLNIFGKLLPKEAESEWGHWAIWNISTVNKRTGGHPAEFPIELPLRVIQLHSRIGDVVLEPFCGSGTTLVACEQLQRVCYAIELDPHYCDIIINRWEEYTGKKAIKIE